MSSGDGSECCDCVDCSLNHLTTVLENPYKEQKPRNYIKEQFGVKE